jgi:hypothetical protein
VATGPSGVHGRSLSADHCSAPDSLLSWGLGRQVKIDSRMVSNQLANGRQMVPAPVHGVNRFERAEGYFSLNEAESCLSPWGVSHSVGWALL